MMFIVLKIKIEDQMEPYKFFYVVIMKWLLEALASANLSSKKFITMFTNFSLEEYIDVFASHFSSVLLVYKMSKSKNWLCVSYSEHG